MIGVFKLVIGGFPSKENLSCFNLGCLKLLTYKVSSVDLSLFEGLKSIAKNIFCHNMMLF
jgi:hypothetical protein